MNESLQIIKILVSIGIVLILSLLAEYLSPKIAGIISGFPTGTAISLFFFGYEVSPEFAAESAIYNLAGLSSMCIFIFSYYMISKYLNKKTILLSSLGAIISYFISIIVLKYLSPERTTALLIAITSTLFFIYIFRNVENIKIERRKKLRLSTIILRSIVAGIIIFVVTLAPRQFGSHYSGLFSAFPTTLFPLILIIHYNYSKEHAHTIIKNVPQGFLSLIVFSLSVSFFFPEFGIVKGLIISYGLSVIWIISFSLIIRKLKFPV